MSDTRRWYDNDPIVIRALELLRISDKQTKKEAALKLLTSLKNNVRFPVVCRMKLELSVTL